MAFSVSLVYECLYEHLLRDSSRPSLARKEQCVIFLSQSAVRRLRLGFIHRYQVYIAQIMCLCFIDNINIRISRNDPWHQRSFDVIEVFHWNRYSNERDKFVPKSLASLHVEQGGVRLMKKILSVFLHGTPGRSVHTYEKVCWRLYFFQLHTRGGHQG